MTDVEIFEGDSHTLSFSVTRDGGSVDLTDATLRWAVGTSVYSDEKLVKTSDDDDIYLGDTKGEVVVELSSTDTSSFDAPETLYHELEVSKDNKVATAATGSITLKPTILKTDESDKS